MVARKLSVVARCLLLAAAAIVSYVATSRALAQDRIQAAAPSATIANPFVAAGAKPRALASEPNNSHVAPVTYQNPFAAASKAPPVDSATRSGSLSRWRRPTISPAPNSDLRTATVAPSQHAGEMSREAQSPVQKSLLENIGSDQIIRSTPNTLNQPPSIDTETASTSSVPVIAGSGNHTAASTIPNPTDFGADRAMTPPAITFGAIAPTKQADHSDIAAVLTSCDDSPEGWLAQAQDAAKGAESVEKLSAVIALCERGLQHTPEKETMGSLRRLSAWAHNRRGELLADSQQEDEAVQDFQVAISMDPTCSLAIHNRAVTLAQRNQYGAALRDFNRVIELNPGLAVAYRNRAELLATLGRTNEAIADYDQAIASLPDDVSLLCARAHAYQRSGNFADAAADIHRAMKSSPQDPNILTQRGNLAAEQGRFEKARGDFEAALSIDANCFEALRSLAWLQATCPDHRFRDAKKAIEVAERAARQTPEDDYRVLDTMAAAHACGNRFEQAVQLQQKAVAAAPRDLSTPLEERLSLYQRGRAYVASTPRSDVRTVSHETSPAKSKSRPISVPKQLR